MPEATRRKARPRRLGITPPASKSALLQRVSIFAQLEPAELDKLAECTTTKRLRSREVLCRQGEPGSQVYVIMSGRIRVTSTGDDGRETVLSIMGPFEVAGEIALLDGLERSATMTAIEPGELLVLQRRDLLPFLRRHPETALKLLESTAKLVRRLSKQLEDRVLLNLRNRLAKKLLALGDTYGEDRDGGVYIDLKLPQGELGKLVGTSRESINKQLRAWVARGVIKSEKGYLTLLDLDALEDLASPGF